MAEPYTIRIYVPAGDPEGVKIVDRFNWTGVGVAFPRILWPEIAARSEFTRAGVYILTGTEEGSADDLPTIYVGQGDGVGERIKAHYAEKVFWEWGYAFVSSNSSLNRAHITWLEYALLERARNAGRCHLNNANAPREPGLTEAEKADTEGFLGELLRILPLLGVRVFEKPVPIASSSTPRAAAVSVSQIDERDTIIVPAQEDGFRDVFLGENCWYAIRISGGMLTRIKHIAAYQTAPVSAITHYAPVRAIEPYGDEGKYRLIFSEPAKPLGPIPFANAPTGCMQGPPRAGPSCSSMRAGRSSTGGRSTSTRDGGTSSAYLESTRLRSSRPPNPGAAARGGRDSARTARRLSAS
ncbi:excinuclease ABC subunit C [Sorangium cellulosum]|uniref:Excinuclease ABC subunit C n=1 Tax=Sorangium cellulosum TaxID=56 RepID=A0A4P2QA48_SORCE|nr:GIY-YIG nuclease family protein [Sorangium cellulosum]AUX26136.1 excinuclease ABC subunit C [Sorangium cellulosum]